ncbi:MAG: O-antigen ligase family protein [Polaromonas sp.]|nr:O-antigen ligase family protein [Polaromonas sp.]
MPYALKSIFSDRKILYILPLALIFSDEGPKRKFLAAFMATSVVGLVLSFAVINHYLHVHLRLNPYAVFRSHATQGMVFAICVFLALWFGFRQKIPVWRWGFYGLAGAFFLNLAMVTPGRSGYVVFLVLTVWAFSMWRGFKGVVIGVLVASVLGVGAFYASSSVRGRVMEGVTEVRNYETSPTETSLGRRMIQYQTTWGMIQESPVLGVGTGGFKQHFSAIAAKNYTGWRAIPFDDPHNQYLFILAENGVIGLLAFLAVIGMMLKYCLKGGSIYGKMAAGCVLAWCATSLFSGHFRTFPEGHLIAFIVGILMVNRPSGDPGKQLG